MQESFTQSEILSAFKQGTPCPGMLFQCVVTQDPHSVQAFELIRKKPYSKALLISILLAEDLDDSALFKKMAWDILKEMHHSKNSLKYLLRHAPSFAREDIQSLLAKAKTQA